MRSDPLPKVISGVSELDKLESFILDLLALKICQNEEQIQAALTMTMLDATETNPFALASEALKKLQGRKMINVSSFLPTV